MRKYILTVLLFSILTSCSHVDIRIRSEDSIRNQCLRDFPIGTDKEEVKRRLLGYFPNSNDYAERDSSDGKMERIYVNLGVHYYLLLPVETRVYFSFDKKTKKLIDIEVNKGING